MKHASPPRSLWRLLPSLLALVLVGCLPGAGQGCNPDSIGVGKPVVELGRGTLAVLPFATPRNDYFESKIGARFSRDIAERVAGAMMNAKVLDVDAITDLIDPPKGGSFSIVRMGEDLKADYVLFGEIHDLRGKPPKSFGVLRGTMIVTARVVDVRGRRVVWRAEHEKYTYPPKLMGKEEIPADSMEEEEVIKKTMREAAKGLAAVFTGRKLATGERIDKAIE